MKTGEKEIRGQVKDYLRWKGWFVFHVLQGLGSYPGISDLIAIKNGRVVFIELKTARGRQGEKQKEFQADIEAAGGEYLIVRNIEDLQEVGM